MCIAESPSELLCEEFFSAVRFVGGREIFAAGNYSWELVLLFVI